MENLIKEKLSFYKIENIEEAIDEIIQKEKNFNTLIYTILTILSVIYIFGTGFKDIKFSIGASIFSGVVLLSALIIKNKSFSSYKNLTLDKNGYVNLFKYISSLSFIDGIVDKNKSTKDVVELNEINISEVKNIEYKMANNLIESLIMKHLLKVCEVSLVIFEIASILVGIICFDTINMSNSSIYFNFIVAYPVIIVLIIALSYGLIGIDYNKKLYSNIGKKLKEYYESGLIDSRYYRVIIEVSKDYKRSELNKALEYK